LRFDGSLCRHREFDAVGTDGVGEIIIQTLRDNCPDANRSRAQELAEMQAPEVTRRDTRIHFIQPLKECIVHEVGYCLSLEGASSTALVKSKQAASERAVWKIKSARARAENRTVSGLVASGYPPFIVSKVDQHWFSSQNITGSVCLIETPRPTPGTHLSRNKPAPPG
jgi:hypothetical protein